MRRRQGRFSATPVPTAVATRSGGPVADSALSADDLGSPLGAQATLVQFSTEVCAYCGPARKLLSEVAAERHGVAFVEIDAAQRMDLSRRLRVLSTPTVLVLGPDGTITKLASGQPRRPDVLVALGAVIPAPQPTGE